MSEPKPEFLCPITLEVMQDPVVAADGFTYEREAIATWIRTGRRTSPCTNLPLEHTDLVPNHALAAIIRDWAALATAPPADQIREALNAKARGPLFSPQDFPREFALKGEYRDLRAHLKKTQQRVAEATAERDSLQAEAHQKRLRAAQIDADSRGRELVREVREVLQESSVDEAIGEVDCAITRLRASGASAAPSASEAELWGLRGHLMYRAGRLQDALGSYQRSVGLCDKDAFVLNDYAIVLAAAGMPVEALAMYDASVAALPSADAYNNRGVLLHSMGRLEDADASFGRALQLLDAERDTSATEHTKAVAAAVWRNRGALLREMKKNEDALLAFNESLRLRPGHAPTLAEQREVMAELRRAHCCVA
eukprot:m51a1_g14225 putative u-box domain-containing protein 54 (368) ;mRNA; f:195413-196583